jgi:hypothetical protein
MEWEMKKSLSELEIIHGARDVIEGVECSRTCGNTSGSGGGPVYITDGQNGVSSSKYWQRSLSLYQGIFDIIVELKVLATKNQCNC